VTQILRSDPRRPSIVLHNRLTHSLKAAQIAQTIAERLRPSLPELDPQTVHAAAMAHDLGHPPYGHFGESVLDRLVVRAGLGEGFDANAQTFRIVVKLACRDPYEPGLNLTRATLNAILKYPWFLGQGPRSGVYPTERLDFEWARSGLPADELTSEAQLVSYSDDLTFALHDLEDFYLVGAVSLSELVGAEEADTSRLWSSSERARSSLEPVLLRRDRRELLVPYRGLRSQYGQVRLLTSELITRWIDSVRCENGRVQINETSWAEISYLKQFIWDHVIMRDVVASDQRQREVILRSAFGALLDWVLREPVVERLPLELQEIIQAAAYDPPEYEEGSTGVPLVMLRAIRDFLASRTEGQLEDFVKGAPLMV
jgi:dGTPase